MKVIKTSKTITLAEKDGNKFAIAKTKSRYEVFANGADTGYKFRSLKKALEYCEFGF